jgi:hypothetical protein
MKLLDSRKNKNMSRKVVFLKKEKCNPTLPGHLLNAGI